MQPKRRNNKLLFLLVISALLVSPWSLPFGIANGVSLANMNGYEPQWHFFTIDSLPFGVADGSINTSIAIDSGLKIHATYDVDQELRYARFDHGHWTTQTIDFDGLVIAHAIAIDKSDNPHIAYLVADQKGVTSGVLRYATLIGTQWVTATVDAESSHGGMRNCAVSIAVDDGNRVHITYGAIPKLKYALKNGNGWNTQVIAGSVYGNMCNSLDITHDGTPQVAYYSMTPRYESQLTYAVLSTTQWISSVVDTSINNSDFGLPSSLQLNESDQPHVLYFGGDSSRLKHAYLTNSGWLSETIPSPNVVDRNHRGKMSLDASGLIHVSFTNQYGVGLVYAVSDNQNWGFKPIDDALGAGSANAIAAKDRFHVAIIYNNLYLRRVEVAQTWLTPGTAFLPITRRDK